MYGCIVESHESTRQRPEPLQSQFMKIALQETTSLTRYNLVHKFIPEPQAMKLPVAEAARDKEWKNSRLSQHGIWRKSKARRSLFWKHKRQKEDPFFHIDGLMSPLKCGVGTETTEVQRQSRALERTLSNTTLEPTHFY